MPGPPSGLGKWEPEAMSWGSVCHTGDLEADSMVGLGEEIGHVRVHTA